MQSVAVKIIEMSPLRQAGGHDIIDLKVRSLDTQKEYKVGCFLHGDTIQAKVGDEVVMGLNAKENVYKGKKYMNYACSAKSISLINQPTEQPTETHEEKPTNDVWERKDRRIVRQSSWDRAVTILEMFLTHGMYSDEEKSELGRDLMWQEAQKYAHMVEEDVYRNLNSVTEPETQPVVDTDKEEIPF